MVIMMRSRVVLAILLASLVLVAGSQLALAQWPTRPIENSVWSSAGGATDFANRLISAAMEKHLGVTINVINRTGGGGGIAMNHVWSRPHTGDYWLGASEAMQNTAVMGFHHTVTRDWRWYMVGGAPGSLAVPENSPYQTLEEFLEAARQNPRGLRISHCAIGCVWHLKIISLESAAGVEFTTIPYEGSAPAMVAAVTGEVDAVVSGIQEQAEYIRAGKLRSLGMVEMTPFEFPGIGTIPAIGETYPGIALLPARQWVGFAIPKDVPADRVAKIDAAFEAAMKDEELLSKLNAAFLQPFGQYGEAALEILLPLERAVSWKLWELGIAEISPEQFGIEKP